MTVSIASGDARRARAPNPFALAKTAFQGYGLGNSGIKKCGPVAQASAVRWDFEKKTTWSHESGAECRWHAVCALLRWIALISLFICATSSHALVPLITGWKGANTGDTLFSSDEVACAAQVEPVTAYWNTSSLGPATSPGYKVNQNNLNCQVGITFTLYGTTQWMHTGIYQPNPVCPAYSTPSGNACMCNADHQEDTSQTSCVRAPPEPSISAAGAGRCDIPDGLRKGRPILPSTGEKYRSELDYADSGPGALSFTRIYRSAWDYDNTRPRAGLGAVWNHNHSARLRADVELDPHGVGIASAEGYLRTFVRGPNSAVWVATNSTDTLVRNPDGAWSYRRADDDVTLGFTSDGKLLNTTQRNGWAINYTYNSAGFLSSISNTFGRSLALAYNGGDQLVSVTAQDGRAVGYGYDTAGRLALVTYPDGKTRSFLYENASFPQALTGIVDEAGVRWGTFSYDTQGRAVTTELAGGVERYQVSYSTGNVATVVDPLGTSRGYRYSTVMGKLAVVGGTLPSGEGESDARYRVQDANGLITSETDFKGVVTTTTWDVSRRLPLSVTRASDTPEAQTVTTQWHPSFALPALVTETGRTTAWTYDAQGNALSQTITDTATNKTQVLQWTYNAQGLAATQTDPTGAVTTYTYDTLGNLTKATNALGRETLNAYDGSSRVISTTSPNNVVTTYAYDARDRLLTRSTGSQQTTLTYNPTGTLATFTLSTGLVLSYTYDAAHRLTGWSNNRGEQGSFTLDAMGNRTAEQTKNASGAVAWNAVRSINNLNRVSAKTDGPNQTNTFGYDANGELVIQTNGLNESTQYGLDGLRRVKAIATAAANTPTLAYNALDAVIQAKDFKGVITTYGRDAQGNATSETSADIGSVTTEYDAAGLPSRIVDAMGQATTITRDLLGRPTQLIFADGKTTTLRYDLTPTSIGYLSEIIDRSGMTEYTRDALGRVTLKRQTLASGLVQQVSYAYTPSGLLASITYPDGNVLGYVYDGTGLLTQLSWNGQPLVSGIAWNPMGQPTAWNWAFVSPSLNASRSYDTAGRLTATEFSSYVYNAAGRITSLTQQLLQPGDADPTHSTIAIAPVSWTTGYDAVGRITGFNATGNTAGFGYYANGNRASSTRTINGQTTSRSYTVDSLSNKLTGFSQTIAGASTSVSYGYNANGDMTSDGLRSYSYDAEGRLSAVTTGATDASPTTRYAHNALGQRVFKTEPLYPPAEGDETNAGFMQSLMAFFTKLWGPGTSEAEKLGFAFMYDEDGTLIAETGMGGANSAGSTQYIYLPTASGPMPVAVVVNGTMYAVHSDHLNTPRRLTSASGLPVWQWAYSAFGDEKPTHAKNRFANLDITPNPGTANISVVDFKLRYPGQTEDKESGLYYNYFRSYDSKTDTYTQNDPIGLRGGWNRRIYAAADPLMYIDPLGLANSAASQWMRPKPSGPPADTTLQIGLAGNLGASVIGIAGEVGLATNSRFDDVCVYVQACGVAGPQIVASCGVSYSAGDGLPSSGVSTATGVTWFGGAGFVGAGQITVNDAGQFQGARGGTRGQIGAGAGAGYVDCTQRTWCVRR